MSNQLLIPMSYSFWIKGLQREYRFAAVFVLRKIQLQRDWSANKEQLGIEGGSVFQTYVPMYLCVCAPVCLCEVYVECMHNAQCRTGTHRLHCVWSASMCQRDKTQLVVYQKGHDGAEQYTWGCVWRGVGGMGGVYFTAAVFQTII